VAADERDGLDESAEKFIGELLAVTPHHGYGWSHNGKSIAPPPSPFHMRLHRLWNHDGTRRGGVAQVEQPGHPCDGLWVVFSTRHVKPYDLASRTDVYNLDLGAGDPIANAEGWPMLPAGGANFQGWGNVAALAPLTG
jgi:hypothetical protein